MNPVIDHTPDEVRRIEQSAQRLQDMARKRQVPNGRVTPKNTSIEIERMGRGGELALSKYLGVPIDLDNPTPGPDGDIDMVYRDRLIQIKTPMKYGRRFLVRGTDKKKFIADYGVLIWPVDGLRTFEIAGAITYAKFQQIAEIRDVGHGPTLFIWDNNELMTIEEMVELIDALAVSEE